MNHFLQKRFRKVSPGYGICKQNGKASWLAGWLAAGWLAGWLDALAGWLAGWLAYPFSPVTLNMFFADL